MCDKQMCNVLRLSKILARFQIDPHGPHTGGDSHEARTVTALYVLESVARRREDERSAGRYESAAPIPRSQRDPLIMDGASFEGGRKVYV